MFQSFRVCSFPHRLGNLCSFPLKKKERPPTPATNTSHQHHPAPSPSGGNLQEAICLTFIKTFFTIDAPVGKIQLILLTPPKNRDVKLSWTTEDLFGDRLGTDGVVSQNLNINSWFFYVWGCWIEILKCWAGYSPGLRANLRWNDFTNSAKDGEFTWPFWRVEIVTSKGLKKVTNWIREWHLPGDSMWPFHPLVGGHLTIPKRSLWITRSLM